MQRAVHNKKQHFTTIDNNNDINYLKFVNSIKSKVTKMDYTYRLKYFINFLNVKSYSELVENKDKKTIENDIINYLIYLRKDRGLSYSSASQYLEPIKKFYYVNSDYDFKWKLIKNYLGDDDDTDGDINNNNNDEVFEDRPYTKQEIQTMLKTATDIRVKIIILLMSSSGMRMGAIPLLRLRNLKKIEKYNLYQINVYEKSKKSNYKTFCTPECASIIDTYLQYRKRCGEEEDWKPEAPLIREQFNPSDSFKVKNPKSIGTSLIRYLVNEVLTKYSALKQKLEYDYENKRKIGKNPTMLTHGLRKYFDTESRKAGVYPDIVELLMGHRLPGIRKHYFKLDIQTLLEGTAECKGYVAAIDALTINEENRLSKQVQELKQQDDYQKYIIDKKINDLTSKLNEYEEIQKEGRIISRERAKQFQDIYDKVQVLMAKFDQERQENRDFELETDPVAKDSKFEKYQSTTRDCIKHQGNLEKTIIKEQI
jgi:hypothetical protein